MQFPTSGLQPLEPGDPVQVGAYRLLGRLGHGGMGQVFLGVSRGGRQVAVKVMRPDLVADPEFRARFTREVAAARTVNGFYTAPVVDADPDATPPWMVTAYVQGPSLAGAVDQNGPLAEPEVRGLAAALAEGLASIHASGLVHRDLKPANIILASDGPRIIDFGIARPVGASTLTEQGAIIGTFTYMSPEQVRGLVAGPYSDVFSLGSVIVFAATGHGPFEADSQPAIIHRILSEPPDLASLPGSLNGLVSGCLAKDRKTRLSLEELLTRLEAADTPLRMPAPDQAATVHASISVPVALPVAASGPGPVVAPPTLLPAAGHGAIPAGTTQRTGPAHADSPALLTMLRSSSGWQVREVAFAPDERLVAVGSFRGAAWRIFVWDIASEELAGEPVDGRGSDAPRLAFSPDGTLLIVKERGAVRLLNLATRQFVSLSAGRRQHSWQKVRFSPDGRLLATAVELRRLSGFTAHQIHLWDGVTLQPVAGPVKADYVVADSTFAFSPDSRYLLAGHERQGLLGDLTAPRPVFQTLTDLRATLGRASFSPDGGLLAVERADGKAVSLLDAATRTPLANLVCDRDITRIEFSPALLMIAVATASAGNEAVELCYLTESTTAQWGPTPLRQFDARRLLLGGFRLPVADLRFSPDGAFLAAASRATSMSRRTIVGIWEADSARSSAAHDLPGPARIAFSPDSQFLAASCADQVVRVISLRTTAPVDVLPGTNAAFSPKSQLLATTAPAGVRLWTMP